MKSRGEPKWLVVTRFVSFRFRLRCCMRLLNNNYNTWVVTHTHTRYSCSYECLPSPPAVGCMYVLFPHVSQLLSAQRRLFLDGNANRRI